MNLLHLEANPTDANPVSDPSAVAADGNPAVIPTPEDVDPHVYWLSGEAPLDKSRYDDANDEAPMTLASQALVVEWALEGYARKSNEDVGKVLGETHHIASLALLANTSKIDTDNLGITVVGPGPKYVNVSGPAESPTGFLMDPDNLTPGEIATARDDYEHISTDLPKTLQGSGAEILDIYSPDERQVVIEALMSTLKTPPMNNGDLLTHGTPDNNDASQYFSDEARVILETAGYEVDSEASRWANFRNAARSLRRSMLAGAYAAALVAKIGRS